jgi:lysyl-tRNA synthetase class I
LRFKVLLSRTLSEYSSALNSNGVLRESWKQESIRYASKWIDRFIEKTVLFSKEHWVEIFGSYEDCPTALLKDMVKFSETTDEIRTKKEVKNAAEQEFTGECQSLTQPK